MPMLFIVTIPLAFIMITHAKNSREYVSTIIFALIALIAALLYGKNIFGCIPYLLVATVFLCPEYLSDIYIQFKKIYVWLIAISAIVWILVLLGVHFPSHEIMPLNELKDHNYFQYPFLVMPDYDIGGSIFDAIRFCGLFDEPGVVGTISLLMLAADNYNLRKPANIVLFITGIFSLSLFFYLGSAICISVSLFISNSSLSKKLLLAITFISLLFISYQWDVTHDAIWNRLEYDEYKGFSGNNRAEEDLKQYIEQIRGTEEYWFGIHDKEIVERYADSASIQNAILSYGVFGCIIYAFFFIIYIFRKNSNYKNAIFCILVLFMTLWQRPVLYNIPYLFLYLIMITNFGMEPSPYIKEEKEENN